MAKKHKGMSNKILRCSWQTRQEFLQTLSVNFRSQSNQVKVIRTQKQPSTNFHTRVSGEVMAFQSTSTGHTSLLFSNESNLENLLLRA